MASSQQRANQAAAMEMAVRDDRIKKSRKLASSTTKGSAAQSIVNGASWTLIVSSIASGAFYFAALYAAPASIPAVIAVTAITAATVVGVVTACSCRELGIETFGKALKAGAIAGVGGALLSFAHPTVPLALGLVSGFSYYATRNPERSASELVRNYIAGRKMKNR